MLGCGAAGQLEYRNTGSPNHWPDLPFFVVATAFYAYAMNDIF
jgi:hypothetical protein